MRCLVAFLLLAGVMAAQETKPESKATISGVVKDTNGAPVAEVAVNASFNGDPRTLMMRDGGAIRFAGPPLTAFTDESGNYSMKVPAPGSYTVRTDRDPAPKTTHVDVDQEVTFDFVVPANSVISGRVVNQNDEPAVDTFVWLLKSAYDRGVLKQIVIGPKVTTEDGSYSFDTGLEANRRYYLIVDRPPPVDLVPAPAADLKERGPIEVPTYYPSATRLESATGVILQPGETREQVDIKIATAPFYCVEGKIQIAGKPASADYAVQDAALVGSRLARMRAYAAGDGKYHACGLSPGSYRLTSQEGFTEFSISHGDLQHIDLSTDTASPRLQIDWDGEAAASELPELNAQALATLRKIAGLMGQDSPSDGELKKIATQLQHFEESGDTGLMDAMTKMQTEPDSGREMGNLMMTLMPRNRVVRVTVASLTSGFRGPLRDSVPSGEYAVEIMSLGDSYLKEITFNGVKLSDGILRIPPGSGGTLHVLMAHGMSALSLSVADSEGKPVPNASVVVVPESVTTVAALSRDAIHGKADQNGDYSIKSLPPGKYRVLATPQSVRWDAPEDLEKILLVMFQAQDVELASKATLQVTLAPVPI